MGLALNLYVGPPEKLAVWVQLYRLRERLAQGSQGVNVDPGVEPEQARVQQRDSLECAARAHRAPQPRTHLLIEPHGRLDAYSHILEEQEALGQAREAASGAGGSWSGATALPQAVLQRVLVSLPGFQDMNGRDRPRVGPIGPILRQSGQYVHGPGRGGPPQVGRELQLQLQLQLRVEEAELPELGPRRFPAARQAERRVEHLPGVLRVAEQPLQMCILLPEAEIVAVFWLLEEVFGEFFAVLSL